MKTYTMYLRRLGEEACDFEPVLCASDAEAILKARELLGAQGDVDSVEVYFGDRLLVTLD